MQESSRHQRFEEYTPNEHDWGPISDNIPNKIFDLIVPLTCRIIFIPHNLKRDNRFSRTDEAAGYPSPAVWHGLGGKSSFRSGVNSHRHTLHFEGVARPRMVSYRPRSPPTAVFFYLIVLPSDAARSAFSEVCIPSLQSLPIGRSPFFS